MKPTKDDCITMYNALSAIKQPEFADIKDLPDRERYIFHMNFAHAVAANKRKLKDAVDSLQEASKPSEDYDKYTEKRDKILQRYAVKDAEGAPRERMNILPGGLRQKSYIVPDMADPSSQASKAIAKLERDSKEVINIRKKQEKDFEKKLKEDAGDLKLELVRWSQIPAGMQPFWMDGIIFMIDPDSEKPVDDKP